MFWPKRISSRGYSIASPFPRRLLETSEMVRLAETNSALRQLWRELLEDRKWGRGAVTKKRGKNG
jgi:hypothetical protein